MKDTEILNPDGSVKLQLSASTVNAAECSYYFKSIQEQKRKGIIDYEGPNVPVFLLIGRCAHRVIEKYTASLLKLKEPSDLTLFESIYDAVWNENKLIPETAYDTIKDDLLLPFIESFSVDIEHTWRAEEKIALDWNLEKVEWDSPQAWLRCVLDRIDVYPEESTANIVDYKTSYHIPEQSELEQALQTLIYPFALHKLNPFLERFYVQYSYIRWCKNTTPIEITTSDFDKIEKRLRGFTKRMVKKMEDPEAEWQAIPGALCKICHLECPLLSQGITPIRTIEDARNMGRGIIRRKQELDEMTDKLKVFAKESEVEIETGIFGYHPTVTYRGFKADKLVAFAQEKEIPLSSVVQPATKKIKAMPEDEVKAEILKMAKASIGTKFSFKKKGQEPDKESEEE